MPYSKLTSNDFDQFLKAAASNLASRAASSLPESFASQQGIAGSQNHPSMEPPRSQPAQIKPEREC